MEAALFLNGEKADLQAFIQNIVSATIEAYKQATNQTAERTFNIDPKRVYSLTDAELANYLGYTNVAKPATSIAAELRRYGFEPLSRSRRNGLCATGQMIMDYLAARTNTSTNYLKRK